MICGNCNKEIDYKPETVTFHLDGKCRARLSGRDLARLSGGDFQIYDETKFNEEYKRWAQAQAQATRNPPDTIQLDTFVNVTSIIHDDSNQIWWSAHGMCEHIELGHVVMVVVAQGDYCVQIDSVERVDDPGEPPFTRLHGKILERNAIGTAGSYYEIKCHAHAEVNGPCFMGDEKDCPYCAKRF